MDVQLHKHFEMHHIKGSIEINEYPKVTEEDLKKLVNVLQILKASKDDVVIICPRGGSGARGTYEYFKSKGVEEKGYLFFKTR